MKKILSIVALALFLGAGIIGCSSSSTTATTPPSGGSGTGNMGKTPGAKTP